MKHFVKTFVFTLFEMSLQTQIEIKTDTKTNRTNVILSLSFLVYKNLHI